MNNDNDEARRDWQKYAMFTVDRILELSGADVETRQRINDECDNKVREMIARVRADERAQVEVERRAVLPPDKQEQHVISMTQTEDVFHRAECLDELESFWWDLRYRNVDLTFETELLRTANRDMREALKACQQCITDFLDTVNFNALGLVMEQPVRRLKNDALRLVNRVLDDPMMEWSQSWHATAWIPVAENSPVVGQSVVLRLANGDVHVGDRTSKSDDWNFRHEPENRVVAWFPIPEFKPEHQEVPNGT